MARAHILVVEDAFVVAKRLQLSLERAGFAVDVARNGREALAKSRRRQYDLIVTDEKMPIMSGRELCRELRQNGKYPPTPILFLTANPGDLDTEELSAELMISTVFEKPFRPEAILHWIANELVAARTS